jgi:hypothetical protein
MSPTSANSTWFSRVLLKQFWFRGDARGLSDVTFLCYFSELPCGAWQAGVLLAG